MLICPQCEFENPQANKFCQNCGISLTHKTCCQCQEDIPVEAEVCDLCGAANHTVLWAIISQPKLTPKYQSEFDRVPIRVASSNSQLKIENLCELFTDCQSATDLSLQLKSLNNGSSRYKIEVDDNSQPLLTQINGNFLQGKVIDRYPLQRSHLATLQKQQMDVFTELKQSSNSSYLSVSQYWNLIGLPTHALPYLILEKYTPIVPKIYDAWQQEDRGVVLLPDRSQWKLLTELWSQELPKPQIIWFLDEMAKLWQPLEQVGCTQSLLIAENLRIDEDLTFCLQQLYINPEVSFTLKDLARTWQFCFTKSSSNNLDYLERLLDRVISEEITEIEQLRSELQNLSIDESKAKFPEINPNLNPMNTFSSEAKNNQLEPDLDRFEFDVNEDFFDDDEEMSCNSEFEELDTVSVPMQLRSITDASCTDIGVQRDHNEDFFGVRTLTEKIENNSENDLSVKGLYIVCDGMGGHEAGEVASAMAVAELQQFFQTHWQSQLPDRSTIEKGILLTNKALYQSNLDNSRSGSGRMGTTLAMALLQDIQCTIAHVGDSRIYRIGRKRGLEQLTLDHEVGQREINRGVESEIAYGRPDAYQLTQALGPRDNDYVRPEIHSVEITEDCLLLLCSGGLSDNEFVEQNWSQHLQPLISSSANLQDGLFKLINLANEQNGHDNITAVLIRIKLKPNF